MRLSLLLRRAHMYLGLFLAPWMAMYAASTALMNHHEHLKSLAAGPPEFDLVDQRDYGMAWAPDTSPAQMAEQILRDLGLEGRYSLQAGAEKITFLRNAPVAQYRITYFPSAHKLSVERERFHAASFLERFHRRRGYNTPWLLENAWAASVDLVLLAMLFWAASGLWLWWEVRAVRFWGGTALAGGLAVFVIFLCMI